MARVSLACTSVPTARTAPSGGRYDPRVENLGLLNYVVDVLGFLGVRI